jgi:hypothetical protein
MLRENFAYWLSKWNPCRHPSGGDAPGLTIPTTHTFPAERWEAAKNAHVYPYREILFEDQALLSNFRQRSLGRIPRGELGPKMEEARAANLDKFVFAYLGVHDPYYARQTGCQMAYKAFGVFLGRDLDVFPACNATRRDLASKEAEKPPNREFLLPQDARTYSQYQVLNDKNHVDDFWHYWGGYHYWMVAEYREKHWEWKIEFHYREEVPVGRLEAILWPVEFVSVRLRGGIQAKDNSESVSELELFRRSHPGVWVVPYSWSSVRHAFVISSYATVRYVLRHQRVPLIPLEVERRFSDPIRIESGCESSLKGENRRGETISHDP